MWCDAPVLLKRTPDLTHQTGNLRAGHKFFMSRPQVEQAAGALAFQFRSYPHIPLLFLRDLFILFLNLFREV